MPPRPSKGLTLTRFDRLVKLHRQRIFGYACHYLRDADEAADVTQDVLVKMWKNRHEIEEERLTAWLLRVTRNVCIDAIRKRNAYQKRVETSSEVIDLRQDEHPGPDRQASSRLFEEQLQAALDKLDEPFRSLVILREIQDFKYEEISEALDLPLNTVKVYLHRARKMLRHHLSQLSRYEYV